MKNFPELVGMDERITHSWESALGPDGERGFGGACFQRHKSIIVYRIVIEITIQF